MIATGSTVTWTELPLDRRYTRRIVSAAEFRRRLASEDEYKPLDTYMPETAPIARAIRGAVPGDVVTVETGFGVKTITIVGVRR